MVSLTLPCADISQMARLSYLSYMQCVHVYNMDDTYEMAAWYGW